MTTWGVHTSLGLAHFYIGGDYTKKGLSLLEALLRFPALLVQAIVGLPFLVGYLLTWGVLHRWYLSGIASACYYLLTSDAFPLTAIQRRSLLVVGSVVQIVVYWRIGNSIDYRQVPLDEHTLFYLVPMVMGMLLVFGLIPCRRTGV